MRGKWFLFAILALPALELLAFILASRAFGFGPALVALLVISALGVLLFKQQRITMAEGIRLRTGGTAFSTVDLSGIGLHRFVAAILLAIPGFITGVLGGLLLIPQVRQRLATRLQAFFTPPQAADPDIVDLPQEDWHVVPDRQIEHKP